MTVEMMMRHWLPDRFKLNLARQKATLPAYWLWMQTSLLPRSKPEITFLRNSRHGARPLRINAVSKQRALLLQRGIAANVAPCVNARSQG